MKVPADLSWDSATREEPFASSSWAAPKEIQTPRSKCSWASIRRSSSRATRLRETESDSAGRKSLFTRMRVEHGAGVEQALAHFLFFSYPEFSIDAFRVRFHRAAADEKP